eukprot:g2550.t1
MEHVLDFNNNLEKVPSRKRKYVEINGKKLKANLCPVNVVPTNCKGGGDLARYGVKLKYRRKQLRIGSSYCDPESASKVATAFKKVARIDKNSNTIYFDGTGLQQLEDDDVYTEMYRKWKKNERGRVLVADVLKDWLQNRRQLMLTDAAHGRTSTKGERVSIAHKKPSLGIRNVDEKVPYTLKSDCTVPMQEDATVGPMDANHNHFPNTQAYSYPPTFSSRNESSGAGVGLSVDMHELNTPKSHSRELYQIYKNQQIDQMVQVQKMQQINQMGYLKQMQRIHYLQYLEYLQKMENVKMQQAQHGFQQQFGILSFIEWYNASVMKSMSSIQQAQNYHSLQDIKTHIQNQQNLLHVTHQNHTMNGFSTPSSSSSLSLGTTTTTTSLAQTQPALPQTQQNLNAYQSAVQYASDRRTSPVVGVFKKQQEIAIKSKETLEPGDSERVQRPLPHYKQRVWPGTLDMLNLTLTNVFGMLEGHELIQGVPLVSKRWNTLSRQKLLWVSICKRDINFTTRAATLGVVDQCGGFLKFWAMRKMFKLFECNNN